MGQVSERKSRTIHQRGSCVPNGMGKTGVDDAPKEQLFKVAGLTYILTFDDGEEYQWGSSSTALSLTAKAHRPPGIR